MSQTRSQPLSPSQGSQKQAIFPQNKTQPIVRIGWRSYLLAMSLTVLLVAAIGIPYWASRKIEIPFPPITCDDLAETQVNTGVMIPVLRNDADPISFLNLGSVEIQKPPKSGQLVHDREKGQIIYTPEPNFTGTDLFTYTVLNLGGVKSSVGTVKVKVVR